MSVKYSGDFSVLLYLFEPKISIYAEVGISIFCGIGKFSDSDFSSISEFSEIFPPIVLTGISVFVELLSKFL